MDIKYFSVIFDNILHLQVSHMCQSNTFFFINNKVFLQWCLVACLGAGPGLSKSGRRRGWAPGEPRGRPEVCSRRSPRTRRPQRSSVVWRSWRWPEPRRERSWPRRCRRWEFSEHLVPRCTQELLDGPEREREKKKSFLSTHGQVHHLLEQ